LLSRLPGHSGHGLYGTIVLRGLNSTSAPRNVLLPAVITLQLSLLLAREGYNNSTVEIFSLCTSVTTYFIKKKKKKKRKRKRSISSGINEVFKIPFAFPPHANLC